MLLSSVSIEEVRKYAITFHENQMYGKKPYIFHLDMVASLVYNYGIQTVTLAYLHDIIEDTPVTIKDIESNFGQFMSTCVSLISDEPGKNRAERKKKTYEKLYAIDQLYYIVLIAKTGDRLANLIMSFIDNDSLFKMYLKEHDAFIKSVYRKSLCDDLWLSISKIVNEKNINNLK